MNNGQNSSDNKASQQEPTISRRDLFRGRFWKPAKSASFKPLVKRYPKSADDLDLDSHITVAIGAQLAPPVPLVKTVSGISIERVPATQVKSIAQRTIPIFRPPGAVNEKQFLAGCTRCNDCSKACPHEAIRPAASRLGAIAGTPTIEADIAACQMCEDFPCIVACKPGVLSDRIPVIMGTAIITAHLCLAHHGTTCTICSERCPVEGAISLANGKPTVNEQACTGCGVCRYVCPAPENAVLLMPALFRPNFG